MIAGVFPEDLEFFLKMADVAAFIEAAGSRFSDLELIGRGSFGDVYKGYETLIFNRLNIICSAKKPLILVAIWLI